MTTSETSHSREPVARLPGSRSAPRRVAERRVLVYSHDTYGLGHLRRSLALARGLVDLPEVESVLLVSGSPAAESFSLPPNCDVVRLPAATKTADGRYASRSLGLAVSELVRVRAELIVAAERAFCPDVIVVDHAPVGMEGELWPLFRELARRPERPALALGLRDVIDDLERVEQEWSRLGVWTALREIYDRILVYADPTVLTTAEELGLSDELNEKMRFVGYVGRGAPAPVTPDGPPTIVLTVGGGGDGAPLLETYADFLNAWPGRTPFRSLVVTGPFVSDEDTRALTARYAASEQPVEVRRLVAGMESTIGKAAGVIAMAGYNTVVEILASGVPALLVPRVAPRREQAIRAQRLADMGALEVCANGKPTVERIDRFVRFVLAGAERSSPSVLLDGVERTGAEIQSLFATRDARVGRVETVGVAADG